MSLPIYTEETMRPLSRRRLFGNAATSLALPFVCAAHATEPVRMISHRFPALEYIAGKMRSAVPGVEVDTQLMPFDKALELATISFSSRSSTPDIVYANDSTFLTFAKNGWVRPLDDLWEKHKAEFDLGDFTPTVQSERSWQGHQWSVPSTSNVMLFFYRKDLFDKASKQPPQTFVEYRDLARSFNSPLRAGTISCQRPVDAALNECSWYMGALGDGWFDDRWHPIFNDAKGVAAIEMLKEITSYAQQGYTNAANDECMIALQQDTAAMGIQWASRALAMDDPNKSRVVGKIDWSVPPQGHVPFGGDGYCISAFSRQDPDLLFRILCTATNKQNLRGAAGLMVPTRSSLLQDPDLKDKYRFYPAARAALAVGQPSPRLPEFYSVGEFITRRIQQALTGEMTVKAALDAAAGETENFLKGHGYYQ
jgi:ABC-type glycerol-3-phosphate transport system substrate-binding protein